MRVGAEKALQKEHGGLPDLKEIFFFYLKKKTDAASRRPRPGALGKIEAKREKEIQNVAVGLGQPGHRRGVQEARRQVQLEEEGFERWHVALDARRVGRGAAVRQERQKGALRPQQRRQGLPTSQAGVAGDADDCGRGHQEARPRKDHFHGKAEEQRNEGTAVFQKRHFQIQKTSR